MFRRKLPDYIILQADINDVARIAELHSANFARGWSEPEIEQMLARPEVTILVVRTVGAPKEPVSGFNIFRQTLEEAEILSIAVDSEHRGLSLGDRLMRSAIQNLQADRVSELILEVDATNTSAVGLYRKLEFEQVGERPAYYDRDIDQPAANALVMRRSLL